MNVRRILLISITIAAVAAAQVDQPSPAPARATRGLTSSLTVASQEPLRAKPGQSQTSPLLVRVVPGDAPHTQRIFFIGLTPGTYDLRDYVKRSDGQPAASLPPLTIQVVGQWPKEANPGLSLTPPAPASIRGGYTAIAWTLAAIWIAIPIMALARRRLRKPRAIKRPTISTPLTLLDEVKRLLNRGDPSMLSLSDRARLELLVLSSLEDPSAYGAPDRGRSAEKLRAMRASPATRPIVLALEAWLHAGLDPRLANTAAMELVKLLEARFDASPRPRMRIPAQAAAPSLNGSTS